ncbi:CRISPR-associated endonuclease Cas2 [Cellulomonas bogoriensis]|uniref:CRISPR-associated endoribonuclease Cas2 n=1 Tax=Cellulomonas bogoriensis 69B4 = DSM 16987 TaxID=1386082 RepID=A0A0A0C4Z2_9CELL|nr:CRISPR-associated endonuclease Cas2 [Cellulomonas bogoriensis]KGM14439.1 CRISPR-associated protein Cas2 [Cellulomonas bogoriensis 69B4 = DSM 16987]
MIWILACYDIADDDRRSRLSDLLAELGPRVQQSVFECRLPSKKALRRLLGELAALIDPVEDQVRVYELGGQGPRPQIVGTRILEEWRDMWVV